MTTPAVPRPSRPELPALLPGVLWVDPDVSGPADGGRVRRSVRD